MRRNQKRPTRKPHHTQQRARAVAAPAPTDLWTALVEGWRALVAALRG